MEQGRTRVFELGGAKHVKTGPPQEPLPPLPPSSGRGEYRLKCPRCGLGHLKVESTKDHMSKIDPGQVLRYRYRVCTNDKCRYRPPTTQERITVKERDSEVADNQ